MPLGMWPSTCWTLGPASSYSSLTSRYIGSELGRRYPNALCGPQASVWNVPREMASWAGPKEAGPALRSSQCSCPLSALQDSYIQSRADTMQNIESTIVELGSIFQQLAHMVKEQEETIQR